MVDQFAILQGKKYTLELNDGDLKVFCDLIEERAGIHLKLRNMT